MIARERVGVYDLSLGSLPSGLPCSLAPTLLYVSVPEDDAAVESTCSVPSAVTVSVTKLF